MDNYEDEGFKETEEILDDLENQISEAYDATEKQVENELNEYIDGYDEEILEKQKLVDSGEMSTAEYNQWLTNTLATGEDWSSVRSDVADQFTETSQTNKKTTFSSMADVYSINHNYGTYEIESATNISTNYKLYSKETVNYLFENETFYPSAGAKLTASINAGKTKAWNVKQIQSVMISSIMSGEGSHKLAKRIATTVGERNKASDIRNARTMTTCVQNAGRVDAYKKAESQGIEVEKQWKAIHDDRTRHEHRILDNQHVPLDEKFKVGGDEIDFPSDPTAPPYLIYNCRCRLVSYMPKYTCVPLSQE